MSMTVLQYDKHPYSPENHQVFPAGAGALVFLEW